MLKAFPPATAPGNTLDPMIATATSVLPEIPQATARRGRAEEVRANFGSSAGVAPQAFPQVGGHCHLARTRHGSLAAVGLSGEEHEIKGRL
jgi:hypothetical protein